MDDPRGKDGFNVSVLEPGTRIFVATVNSFYELEVVNGNRLKLFGGTRKDGSTRFPQTVEVIFHGSTWGGTVLKIDWIGYNMHMEMAVLGIEGLLTTSRVKDAILEAPDGNWSYSMDWRTNPPKQ